TMREMIKGPTEDFARGLDHQRSDQFPTEFPPWAGRLELAVEKHILGAQPFDGALQAHVVDKTPRLAAKITRHSKDIVKDFGNSTHPDLYLSDDSTGHLARVKCYFDSCRIPQLRCRPV